MAKKKVVKAGDLGLVVTKVKKLYADWMAGDFWAMLDDLSAIMGEFKSTSLVAAKVELTEDEAKEQLLKLCEDMEDCEECDDDKVAAAVEPAKAGWLVLLMPLLVQALKAIMDDLLKRKEE